MALLSTANAQQYPAKPIKIIVGFAAGGASDVTARMLAPKMSALLGQPVVIENRLGSGGAIATEYVAKAPPDGYTLVSPSTAATSIAPHIQKLPYDPLRDFVLDSNHVIGRSVDAVTPNNFVAAHVEQLRVDPEALAGVNESRGQHRINIEFAAHVRWINRVALVLGHDG